MAETARVALGTSQDVFVDGAQLFDPDSPDAQLDPTGLPLQVAFVPEAQDREPTDDEWIAGCQVIVKPAPAPDMPAPLPRIRIPALTPLALGMERGRYTAWAQCLAITVDGQTAPRGVVGALEVT
jgi:hypothetical protein